MNQRRECSGSHFAAARAKNLLRLQCLDAAVAAAKLETRTDIERLFQRRDFGGSGLPRIARYAGRRILSCSETSNAAGTNASTATGPPP